MKAEHLKILYVDHDLIGRGLATFSMWQLGYWNDVVSSGERALAACGRQHYDLIFLDLAMPGMDGYATARAIRSLERQTGQCASLLCGMAAIDDEVLRHLCCEADMAEFIGKPCYREDLSKVIRLAETVVNERSDRFFFHGAAA